VSILTQIISALFAALESSAPPPPPRSCGYCGSSTWHCGPSYKPLIWRNLQNISIQFV